MARSVKIAFIKFGGLSAGGTERWLQTMAVNLVTQGHLVDFYYCDSAPYTTSDFTHPDTDPSRLEYIINGGVRAMRFHVDYKDTKSRSHNWIGTNFFDVFEPSGYDFIQTAKAGPPEFPFTKLDQGVVEMVALDAGVDNSKAIDWSVHLSHWQRRRWVARGGRLDRSSIIPVPVMQPKTLENLRGYLGIPNEDLVLGFHQRDSNEIASKYQIDAFSRINDSKIHFVQLGGGSVYEVQARELGVRNYHRLSHSSNADDISKFLNTLDIYTHGRRDGETFGTAIAEAMIHGIPCVSHESIGGANAHQETMGKGGYFARSFEEYFSSLQTLIGDESLRLKIGSEGKSRAENEFSEVNCALKLQKIYMDIKVSPRGVSRKIDDSDECAFAASDLGFLVYGDIHNPASIANHALVGGIPEEFDLEIARYFFSSASGAIVDVGANIGLYCSLAAHLRKDLDIFAFEPQASCLQMLSETIALNHWSNLHTFEIGLSNQCRPAMLYLAGSGSTLNDEFNDFKSSASVPVSIERFDDWVDSHDLQTLSFIKIDVEGHELKVLEGAEKSILRFRPNLFVEIAEQITGREYKNSAFLETVNFMLERGYVCLISDGVSHLSRYRSGRRFNGVRMFLFVPQNQVHTVTELQAKLRTYRKTRRARLLRRKIRRLRSILSLLRSAFFSTISQSPK